MHTLHFLKFGLPFFVIDNEFAKFNSRRVTARTFPPNNEHWLSQINLFKRDCKIKFILFHRELFFYFFLFLGIDIWIKYTGKKLLYDEKIFSPRKYFKISTICRVNKKRISNIYRKENTKNISLYLFPKYNYILIYINNT